MSFSSEYYQSITFFIGSFAVALIVLKIFVREKRKCLRSLMHIPVLGSLPFMSNMADLPTFYMVKSKSLGNVFALYLGSRYAIILNGRQSIHNTLVKQSLEFAGRPVFYLQQYLNPHMKGFVDAHYDDTFRKYHQLSLSILKEFGLGKGIMENRITIEVAELVLEISKANGQPMKPDRLITHCVVNVISSIIFGMRYDCGDKDLERIIEYADRFVYDSMEIAIVSFFPPLRFIPSFRRKMEKFRQCQDELLKFIDQRIADSQPGNVYGDSFIQSFINAEGPGYDHEQLQFILRDLLIAGSETTVTTLKWAVLLMANHREVQCRIQNEIDSVVPRDRLPSLDDRPRLPYVEATILEIFRNKTIVPASLPRSTMSDVTVDGCYVPAGTTVLVNLYSVHMDPDTWSNPSEFKPERFLNKDGRVVNKELIMPFSVGRRACLGEVLARQEVFLFFTGLLQNFEILPPNNLDEIPFTTKASVTVAPSPYDVRLVPRR